MEQVLAVLDFLVWVLFGLSVVLELSSLRLSIRRALGFRGPSSIVLVPLFGYVVRIVTLERRSALRMILLCIGATVIHVVIAFGVPALVRTLVKKLRG